VPSNVEIKARANDPARLRHLAETLSDHPPEVIRQRDTFFHCPAGRLKLREFSDTTAELIFYARADTAGSKQSHYLIARTSAPSELRAVLAAAHGVRGTVVKTRVLLLAGQTRIHLDAVEGLGDFVELEVVLRPGQPAEDGHRIARELMAALEIHEADLVAGAYLDLLPPFSSSAAD
jgi:adenylate cyclase class IV